MSGAADNRPDSASDSTTVVVPRRMVYDLDAACFLLHQSRPSLVALIQSGQLKAYRRGRRWYVPHDSIETYIAAELEAQRIQARAPVNG